MSVDVRCDDGVNISVASIESDAMRALVAMGLEHAELSIVLTDDARIRILNEAWRATDHATDVLSFPQDPDGIVPVLGDVVISVDTAVRQADEQGHSLEAELRVLLVHGLCHLVGHDHYEVHDTAAMEAEECRVLALLGGADGPPASLLGRARGSPSS